MAYEGGVKDASTRKVVCEKSRVTDVAMNIS